MKKIKLIMTAILITVSIVSLAGCGKTEKKEATGNKTNVVQTTNDKGKDTTKKKDAYQKDKELPNTLPVDLGKVKYCVDTPSNFPTCRTGWYSTKGDMYVTYDQFVKFTSDSKYKIDPTSIKTSDQVIEGMKDQFKNTATDQLPFSMKNDYEITKKENVKVNNWNMCRYEGQFTLDNVNMIGLKDKKANFVAYGIVKDGYPIYFIVVDKSDAQNKAAEIGKLADKIAKTFREYEEAK